MEEIAVGGVFLARTLLHFQHELGTSEGDGNSVNDFGFNAGRGIFVAHAAGLGRRPDG